MNKYLLVLTLIIGTNLSYAKRTRGFDDSEFNKKTLDLGCQSKKYPSGMEFSLKGKKPYSFKITNKQYFDTEIGLMRLKTDYSLMDVYSSGKIQGKKSRDFYVQDAILEKMFPKKKFLKKQEDGWRPNKVSFVVDQYKSSVCVEMTYLEKK